MIGESMGVVLESSVLARLERLRCRGDARHRPALPTFIVRRLLLPAYHRGDLDAIAAKAVEAVRARMRQCRPRPLWVTLSFAPRDCDDDIQLVAHFAAGLVTDHWPHVVPTTRRELTQELLVRLADFQARREIRRERDALRRLDL